MKAFQSAEYERAQLILTFFEESAVFPNILHPAGALFECPLSSEQAANDHKNYRNVLRNYKINVKNAANVITDAPREELVQFAMKQLHYKMCEENNAFGEDKYKLAALQPLSNVELTKIILTQPTIYLQKSDRNTHVETTSIQIKPLSNCIFTRDQQITTRKGVVMSSFAATQRKTEVRVMEFVLKQLGITPIAKVYTQKATLEGGDFVVLDHQTAALGVGLRSSYSAAQFLMREDLLGFERFLVIKDVFDQSQDRMHLDCTFSPLHHRLCAVDESVFAPGFERYVDEYRCLGHFDEDLMSCYRLVRPNVPLSEWLDSNGFSVIRIPHEYQLAYGCNMLNLGLIDGVVRVLTVHEESKRLIEGSPVMARYLGEHGVRIAVEFVSFRKITSMYGSLHCASQVLLRTRESEAAEHCSPAKFEETQFDYYVLVPTFCDQEELVAQVKEKCQKLVAGGSRLFYMNKYWVDGKMSVKDLTGSIQFIMGHTKTVEGPLTLDDCFAEIK